MNVEYIPSVSTGNVQQAAGFLGRTAPNAHFYAWWNNEIYGFGQTDSTGLFSLGIPAAAYADERSFVRIWTSTESNKSQAQLIPLQAGEPITQTGQLNRHDWHAMVMYFLMVDRFKNGDSTNDWTCEDRHSTGSQPLRRGLRRNRIIAGLHPRPRGQHHLGQPHHPQPRRSLGLLVGPQYGRHE